MRRSLDIGDVLTRVFQSYGNHFALILPLAVIVALVAAVLDALAEHGFSSLLYTAVRLLVDSAAAMLFAGLVIEIVRRDRTGEQHTSLGRMLDSVWPVLLNLIVACLLYGIGVAIGLVLLIVPGLILLTWWALVAPVIVVERTGIIESFGRSKQLVDGNGWAVFGVVVILFLLTALISLILVVLFAIIGGFVGSLIGIFLAGVLLKPLFALAAPILYFDLREIEAEDRAAQASAAPPTP
ncbi:MAG TPA: hypothetical protein VHR88_00465 [Solirubrobacteraceae bacterium]|nr:hypothetical protein [Solirubrobacteraceae bacterium]